jgi:hypothetical protein
VKPFFSLLTIILYSISVTGCAVAVKSLASADAAADINAVDEAGERAAIYARVKTLFTAQDYAGLERLADTYRTTKDKTRSGWTKLAVFYDAIGTLADDSGQPRHTDDTVTMHARRWAVRFPNSPTPLIAGAVITLARAHRYRHGAVSPLDDPAAWEHYYALLKVAHLTLLEHPDAADRDPTWYRIMLEIAAEEAWGPREYFLLVARALEAAPDYPEIYVTAAQYFLTPGNEDKLMLERLASLVAERTKGLEGMAMYARIYTFASHHDRDNRLFRDPFMDWTKMTQGMDDVLAEYPDQWNINNFARMACIARDRSKAVELINRIHGRPLAQVWRKAPSFQQCRAWALGDLI